MPVPSAPGGVDRSPFAAVPSAAVATPVSPGLRRPGSPVMPVAERHAAPEVRAAIAEADPRPTGYETAFLLDEEAARSHALSDLPERDAPAPLALVPTSASGSPLRPVIPVDAPDGHALLATVREEDGSIAWAGAGSWPRPAATWRRIDGSRPFGASSLIVDRPTIVALGAVAIARVRAFLAGRGREPGELDDPFDDPDRFHDVSSRRSPSVERGAGPRPATERSATPRPAMERSATVRPAIERSAPLASTASPGREPVQPVGRRAMAPAVAVPIDADPMQDAGRTFSASPMRDRPAPVPRARLSGRAGALREAPHVPGTPAARSIADQLRPALTDGVPSPG
jgi:hypothetical protein